MTMVVISVESPLKQRRSHQQDEAKAGRKVRNREVPSRYKSPSTNVTPTPSPSPSMVARRFPSPHEAAPRRAQSSERRRELLFWPSSQSMSVSMISEPVKLERKRATPSRRQTLEQAENANPSSSSSPSSENIHSKPVVKLVQHRWPSATPNSKPFCMSRSIDLTADWEKTTKTTAKTLPKSLLSSSRAFTQSINEAPTAYRTPSTRRRTPTRDHPRTSSLQQTSNTTNSSNLLGRVPNTSTSVQDAPCSSTRIQEADITDNSLDADSTSSGSTATTPSTTTTSTTTSTSRSVGVAKIARGTSVPARFLQDSVPTTSSKPSSASARRLSESTNKLRSSFVESELPSVASRGKSGARTKTTPPESQPSWSSSPNHFTSSFSSPQRPTKAVPQASPSRSLPSPTRTRPLPNSSIAGGGMGGSLHNPKLISSSASMMLNFGKGKRGALNQTEEAHLYRILQNRLLQWHFVNARTEASINTRTFASEKQLCSVWAKTCELRASVMAKKRKLQQARQAQILNSILSGQISMLEEWKKLQQEHLSALSGILEALEAATLRVPVTAGVRADVRALKEAMGSAVDVMNALESAITFLLPKAERINASFSDLAQVTARERVVLEECGDLLEVGSVFEMEERSLRTHLLQAEQEKARVLGYLVEEGPIGSTIIF